MVIKWRCLKIEPVILSHFLDLIVEGTQLH